MYEVEPSAEHLRAEAADFARKLVVGYDSGDMQTFHFYLGALFGIAQRIYEANAREEEMYGES